MVHGSFRDTGPSVSDALRYASHILHDAGCTGSTFPNMVAFDVPAHVYWSGKTYRPEALDPQERNDVLQFLRHQLELSNAAGAHVRF